MAAAAAHRQLLTAAANLPADAAAQPGLQEIANLPVVATTAYLCTWRESRMGWTAHCSRHPHSAAVVTDQAIHKVEVWDVHFLLIHTYCISQRLDVQTRVCIVASLFHCPSSVSLIFVALHGKEACQTSTESDKSQTRPHPWSPQMSMHPNGHVTLS